MKTENAASLHYSASPLKVIETDDQDKTHLRVLKKEESSKAKSFSFISNASINEASNWDASWFNNYE